MGASSMSPKCAILSLMYSFRFPPLFCCIFRNMLVEYPFLLDWFLITHNSYLTEVDDFTVIVLRDAFRRHFCIPSTLFTKNREKSKSQFGECNFQLI